MDVSGQQFSVFRISAAQVGAEAGAEEMMSTSEGGSGSGTAKAVDKRNIYSESQNSITGGGLVGRRKKLLEAGRREVDSAASATSREQNDAILRHEISGDSLLRIMTENQASMNNKILTLSESGDKDGIETIIDEAATNFKWESCRGLNNYTPLHHACSRGHARAVSYLLSVAPTLLHSMTSSDETPLHLAASCGNLGLLEQLVERGADLDAQTKDGETPLMYAARKFLPAAVRCLLGLGARVHVEDKYGDTAVDYCDDSAHTRRWVALQVYELKEKRVGGGGSGSSGGGEATDEGDEEVAAEVRYLQGLRAVLSFLEASEMSRAACVSSVWHRAAATKELWDGCGVKRWKVSMEREEMGRSGGRHPATYRAVGPIRPKSK
jgi:hypothetical protein